MAQTSTAQITTKQRKNYLSYPYDYYTGQSARIFFGHVWVDDIITLQYTFNQNKSPIYGYASQQFDAIARGQIIVNGNFSIAFKETGYLALVNGILKTALNQKKDPKEILRYWLDKGKPVEKILDELYMSEDSASDFEDLAESLEDYLWDNFNSIKHTSLKRPDEFDYNDKYGIDINGFDVVLTFGDYTDDAAEHTVKVINDVHIISESMIVTPDGSPIGLNYTFFGRGLDEKISNVFKIPDSKKNKKQFADDDINKKLDRETPIDFEILILEAWDNNAERITALTGREFFSWIGHTKMNPELYTKLENTDINNSDERDSLRSDIKSYAKSVLSGINFSTWSYGQYEELSVIKFDIKLILDDEYEEVQTDDIRTVDTGIGIG